jgi:polar amino acid transport system substrate-binding protein
MTHARLSTGTTRRYLLFVLTIVASVLGAGAVAAQTVDDIIKKGKIVVGAVVDFAPFGSLDTSHQPQGYDIDVANLLGKYLGVPVEIVQVTGPNRIPFLLTNKVDIVIASLGITPARALQVAYSIPYSALEEAVIAPRSRKIASAADLSGLRIGVPRGSTDDTAVTEIAPKDAKIMRFDDDASTAQAMITGQVDAIAESTIMLNDVFKPHPELQLESKFVFSRQFNGMAVRRDANDLRRWVDTFIYYVKNNGELDAISRKWVGTPLPELPVF